MQSTTDSLLSIVLVQYSLRRNHLLSRLLKLQKFRILNTFLGLENTKLTFEPVVFPLFNQCTPFATFNIGLFTSFNARLASINLPIFKLCLKVPVKWVIRCMIKIIHSSSRLYLKRSYKLTWLKTYPTWEFTQCKLNVLGNEVKQLHNW